MVKSNSSLSNIFSVSFMGESSLQLDQIICNKCWILSDDEHPLTKPTWSVVVTCGNTLSILVASSSVRIWLSTYIRVTGLKLLSSVGSLSLFKISVNKTSLKVCPSCECFCVYACQYRQQYIVYYIFFEYSTGHLSNPGDLPTLRCKIPFLTSCSAVTFCTCVVWSGQFWEIHLYSYEVFLMMNEFPIYKVWYEKSWNPSLISPTAVTTTKFWFSIAGIVKFVSFCFSCLANSLPAFSPCSAWKLHIVLFRCMFHFN